MKESILICFHFVQFTLIKKIGKYLNDHEYGSDILDVTPKSWFMKEKLFNWTLFKLKLLFRQYMTNKRLKR